MDRKTKNIVVGIIIIILVVCLAFTVNDGKEEREIFNIDVPSTSNRRMPSRDNRFNWPNKDTKEKEEENETEEAKKDNECNCQGVVKTSVNNRNKNFNNIMPMEEYEKTSNTSLKTALIIIESFLLGGSVMYLILNNINNETKEEKTTVRSKKTN